jgi:hypothetical protein
MLNCLSHDHRRQPEILLGDEHVHHWVWLAPGFEVCTGCGKIRRSGGRK